jgi:hypothetical protein
LSQASEYQPNPKPGRENVAGYVLRDIAERVEAGERKYGTRLQTFNGRDALWDAYQEALDLVMYLRQAILERDVVTETKNTPNGAE